MGQTRDYYADLELSSTADIQEIKKQFRKLALLYHPDRNPGREQEVNSQFQIIQSAHEILSDPQSKAKYDSTRNRSNRYPGASGVKGNPWQNVGQDFPPPPRRNAPPKTPTSGAQRWQSRFASGVPPTAKQYASADSETKKNAARAFENMRKSQSQTGKNPPKTQPSEPPPPPPRSQSARQRAEAAFGTRKTSSQARPPVSSQEPPATKNRQPQRPAAPTIDKSQTAQPHPTPMPDPLKQFRNDETYPDIRQRTLYATHGGEKLDPFDSASPNRAKSARALHRRDSKVDNDQGNGTRSKQRSSSVSKEEARVEESTHATNTAEQRRADVPGDFSQSSFTAREGRSHHTQGQESGPRGFDEKPGEAGNGKSSMYGTPLRKHAQSFSVYGKAFTDPSLLNAQCYTSFYDELPNAFASAGFLAPSGQQEAVTSLNPYEKQQHLLLNHLISNQARMLSETGKKKSNPNSSPTRNFKEWSADERSRNSFNFEVNEDTFVRTSPDHASFARSSIDDINTEFSREHRSESWQFQAGNDKQDHFEQNSAYPGSPSKAQTTNGEESENRNAGTDAAGESAFNANGWTDKFGPQTFAPQQTSNSTVSPTRATRTNSRKLKSAKATAGNAAVVDEDSDEDIYEWNGRKSHRDTSVDSPQAMDIDSPPTKPESSQPGAPRNIPVEPSRPEWRPGTVAHDAGSGRPTLAAEEQAGKSNVGSEDSEEFRASLADLKNVAPFAQPKVGLKSFIDLKDNLPFESKASGEVSVNMTKAQPLIFPPPPEAPRLPPTVAIEGIKPNFASWNKYLEDFSKYLAEWEAFNVKVVDHFAARNAHIAHMRSLKGYAFLSARGEGAVQEHYNWIQQDNEVRRRWNAACENHEERFREYMAFREKMK